MNWSYLFGVIYQFWPLETSTHSFTRGFLWFVATIWQTYCSWARKLSVLFLKSWNPIIYKDIHWFWSHNVTTFVFLQSLIWSLIQIKSMWFLAFKGFSSLSFFFLFFSFPFHTFSFLSFIFLPFSFLYSPLRFYFTSEWRKMIVKIHIDFVRSDIHSIVNRLLFLKIFLMGIWRIYRHWYLWL